MTLKRFFKTPKGLLIIVMIGLTLVAAIGHGVTSVAPLIAGAVVAAMLVDAPILRWREGAWTFPDGALLTGLFVALILSPFEPWYVGAATAAIGVAGKYAFRARRANVFNPAAMALVVAFYLFHTGQSWWGSLAELPLPAVALLLATGVFITTRVNKVPAVLAFLGTHYVLFTIAAFAGDPGKVAALYRAPDLQAALFFAFFMVTDPPTSPPKQREQLVFGVIVAAASFTFFEVIGSAYFLLAGLLVANLWEAVRRSRQRQAKLATV